MSEANELIRALGFDPERFRTEAGFINHYKLRAAIRNPQDYGGLMLHTTPGKWVPIKPEGAPYWGIHTTSGETIAGTSSGLCEGDARLICDLVNTHRSQEAKP